MMFEHATVLLLFFVFFTSQSVQCTTPHAETAYLQDLFTSTNGSNWIYAIRHRDEQHWNFTVGVDGEFLYDPCMDDWAGVGCMNCTTASSSSCHHITQLTLQFMNLNGSIASNISALSELLELDLSRNFISGELPSELFTLDKLETLDLRSNVLHGSIPHDISALQNLKYFSVYDNRVTGSLPSSIGLLTQLSSLVASLNLLSQSLPASLTRLTRLNDLWLDTNLLTGSLPSGLGGITSLVNLVLYWNDFTGTLPESLVNLTNIDNFLVNSNHLHGTLSNAFGAMTRCSYFWLSLNYFSGTIPATLGNMALQEVLLLDANLFNGTLPTTLAGMIPLHYFDVGGNALGGSIPEELCNLTNLDHLFMAQNQFSGFIPNCFGDFTEMVFLDLGFNELSKTVPSGIGSMVHLQYLGLQNNHLTGTMPALLNFKIKMLFLQNNRLSGGMREVFRSPWNTRLAHVDLSNNLFSGEVPVEFFLMPNISTVAMSVNCLQGSIPEYICEASKLQVLSMNGLGASDACGNSIYSVFSSNVVLFNTMDGSLPMCLWTLPQLETLHFAGNGLTGSIPEFSSQSLLDINVAHNYLTGHLPSALRERGTLLNLDMSYNRINGVLSNSNVSAPDASISLEVNRLSGSLGGTAFRSVKVLNILDGNMFTCRNLPKNDEHYDLYSCGSQEFNTAFYAWLGVLALVAFTAVFFILVKKSPSPQEESLDNLEISRPDRTSDSSKLSFSYDFNQSGVWKKFSTLMQNHKLYASYLSKLPLSADDEELCQLREFSENIKSIRKYIAMLAFTAILTSLPILSLKMMDNESEGEEQYLTHTHSYAWFFSLAYISGTLPVALVMGGWTCMVVLLIWVLYQLETRFISRHLELASANDPHASPYRDGISVSHHKPTLASANDSLAPSSSVDVGVSPNRLTLSPSDVRLRRTASLHTHIHTVAPLLERQGWKMVGPLLVNALVVFLLNALYIRRLSDGADASMLLFIQALFAVLKVIYSTWVVPVICKPIKDMKMAVWMRVRIYLFNSIWIPVAATLRTSPACFEGLWVARDSLNSAYSFTDCSDTLFDGGNNWTCTETVLYSVDVAPLTPPFLYNYQCASTLMTSYIPIFMYLYVFHLTLPLIMFAASIIKFNTYPAKYIRIKLPGVWWPYHWLSNSEKMLTYEDEDLLARDERGVATPRKLINGKTVVTQIMQHICVLFTFGLCSPQLAIAVICAVVVTSDLLQVMIGRFVHFRLTSVVDRGISYAHLDNALLALSEQLGEIIILVKSCFIPILTTSTLLFCFICFDMTGDLNGWRASIWVPITFACLYIVLILSRRTLRKRLHEAAKTKNPMFFNDSERDLRLCKSCVDTSSVVNRDTMEIDSAK